MSKYLLTKNTKSPQSIQHHYICIQTHHLFVQIYTTVKIRLDHVENFLTRLCQR